jgi:hypothetical protein
MVIPRVESSVLRSPLESVYVEALSRLGVSVSFIGCTPAACGKYVTSGKADGELARAAVYEEIYPELLRVEESILEIRASVFSADAKLKLDNWDDIIESDNRVAYMTGNYLIHQKLKGKISTRNMVHVKHWTEGLDKISNQQADIYIGVESTVLQDIKQNQRPIHLIGQLEVVEVFPYFNKKHKTLAKSLAEKLREMKKDGTLKKLLSSLK